MNKEEVKDLFQDPLAELDEFANEIQKIKNLINLIIENFDLLKEDVTDEQVGDVSSEINVKVSKIIALIKDIMSDSKKLEAFINEIKLLKRKREKKLKKGEKKDYDFDELMKELEKMKQIPLKQNPWLQPNNPYQQPYQQPYTSPNLPPNWKINF
jgi:DNA repair exonuclease SbcCD ATPase subunit